MDHEHAAEERATDRLIFFTDAVVAIAITLLALELPVPSGRNVSEFWRSVREHHDEYLAFLISFFVISASWSRTTASSAPSNGSTHLCGRST